MNFWGDWGVDVGGDEHRTRYPSSQILSPLLYIVEKKKRMQGESIGIPQAYRRVM